MDTFRTREISISLTGEEWFTLAAKLLRTPTPKCLFSDEGHSIYRSASKKLANQIREVSTPNAA